MRHHTQGNHQGNRHSTTSLKALAIKHLQGNLSGNHEETRDIQKKEPVKPQINDETGFNGAAEIITPGGESLWVVTEKDALKLLPSGAVFFTPQEIKHLSEGGRKEAEAALKVKQVFGQDVRIRGVKRLTNSKITASLNGQITASLKGKIRARVIDLFPIGGVTIRARLESDMIIISGLDELNEADMERANAVLNEYPVCKSDFE